ncbi:MAG: DUF1232 domain-containing protein [Parcubacteria group bacterium]|nr:DUF1232 domain-containing protein [Parcubacteria group bacterium]
MEFPKKKFESLWRKFKASINLFFDKKVPWIYKIIPVISIIYLIFPFDFISDYLPILGQLDDLTVIGGSLAIFTKLARQYKQKNEQGSESQDKR